MLKNMQRIMPLITLSALTLLLTACPAAILGGAAVGGDAATQRRTTGMMVEDEGIETKANAAIARQLGEKIHSNVTSFNRVVLITGEAIDVSTKAKAETLIKTIQNVRDVANELTIDGRSSLVARNNDALITSKVKTRMFATKDFSSNNIKVITERKITYLMGVVTRKEGQIAGDIASTTGGVTKVVKVFEYID